MAASSACAPQEGGDKDGTCTGPHEQSQREWSLDRSSEGHAKPCRNASEEKGTGQWRRNHGEM